MTSAIAPIAPGDRAQANQATQAAQARPTAHDPRADKLHHAATEFESMLVKQLLKSAKIGGAGAGDKSNGYADMAVDAMASSVEKGGGLGLARRIEEAVGAHSPHASAIGTLAGPPGQRHADAGLPVTPADAKLKVP